MASDHPQIDMNAITALLSSPDLDDVEFDEEELNNDPDLLADLASIESGGELKPKFKESNCIKGSLTASAPKSTTATLHSLGSSKAASTPNASSLGLELLDSLTEFNSAMAKPSASKTQTKPQQTQSTPVVSADSVSQEKLNAVVTQNPQLAALALKQIDIVENRWSEYKEAIQYCRSKGDVNMEKQYIMGYKTLSAFLQQLKEGTPIDLRKLPAAPTIALAVPLDIDEHDQERLIAFETLEKTVRDQIKMLHEKAMGAKEKGDKVTAVTLFREQKEMMAHLQKVTAAKQAAGVPLPKYQFEDAQYSEEISFQHLADNMLEIEIVKGITIKPPTGQDSVDSYVVLTFPYPTELPQRIQTDKVAKTINPQFNWKRTVKIERKKSFLLTVERKKVVAEIYHSRWFGKDIPLGRAEIKMTDLTSKAEVREIASVMDGRRATGGQLEVIFRLRQPLLKPDVRIVKYKKLVFLQHFLPEAPDSSVSQSNSKTETSPSVNSPAPQVIPQQKPSAVSTSTLKEAAANPKAQPQQKQSSQTTPVSQPGKAQPAQQKPQPQPQPQPEQSPTITQQPQQPQQQQLVKPSTTKQSTKSKATEEEDAEDYNSLDNMISNNVLTWEMSNVQKKMDAFKKANQPVPPDLVDRLQMIEARIQILVLQVQTGKITEQKYASMLKSKVDDEKQQAKDYLQKGNKDAARLALQRAKIMELELQEAGM